MNYRLKTAALKRLQTSYADSIGKQDHVKPISQDETLICAATLYVADIALGMLVAALLESPMLLGVSAFLVAVLAHCELYPGFGLSPAERLRRRWIASVLVFGLAFAAMPSLTMVLAGVLTMAVSPLGEEMARAALHQRGRWGKPVLLAGHEKLLAVVQQDLEQVWQLGFKPVIVGGASVLPVVNTVVLTAGTVVTPGLSAFAQLFVAGEAGSLTRVQPPAPALVALLGTLRSVNQRVSPWRGMKRLLDLVICGGAMVVALPLMLIAAAFIYRADRGPVFYSQYRRGLGGKPIKIWKLRSMYQDSQQRLDALLATDSAVAAEWYARFKLTHDPRVLPGVGHFIRKYSIDELPQLWNVLKGELSLVGPRVFIDYDLAIYSPDALRLRESVMPGLTGLWQVSVRSDGNNEEKVRYDSAYVHHWSLWLDLDILYRTVGVVLTGRGAA